MEYLETRQEALLWALHVVLCFIEVAEFIIIPWFSFCFFCCCSQLYIASSYGSLVISPCLGVKQHV